MKKTQDASSGIGVREKKKRRETDVALGEKMSYKEDHTIRPACNRRESYNGKTGGMSEGGGGGKGRGLKRVEDLRVLVEAQVPKLTLCVSKNVKGS